MHQANDVGKLDGVPRIICDLVVSFARTDDEHNHWQGSRLNFDSHGCFYGTTRINR